MWSYYGTYQVMVVLVIIHQREGMAIDWTQHWELDRATEFLFGKGSSELYAVASK